MQYFMRLQKRKRSKTLKIFHTVAQPLRHIEQILMEIRKIREILHQYFASKQSNLLLLTDSVI